MSEARPQTPTETPQEVRFTALAPILDEALAGFEPEDYRSGPEFPDRLFLFATKRLVVVAPLEGPRDTEYNLSNHSLVGQYRQSAEKISSNGRKEFPLIPGVKELRSDGPDGPLVGVGMRILLDSITAEKLLAPPLYGPADSRRPKNVLGGELYDKAMRELEEVRRAQMLHVRYEFQRSGGDHVAGLQNLRSVLEMGVKVSQLTVVPSTPKAARYRDIFQMGKIDRKYGYGYEAPDEPNELVDLNTEAAERRDSVKNAS